MTAPERPRVQVRVAGFTTLRELPGARTTADHLALLDAVDFGDPGTTDAAELADLCRMALQDLEPHEAAVHVLTRDLGDRLRRGQIENMSHEMQDEKLWEEHPDLSLHERLFTTAALLYQVHPGAFPQPDAVRVRLELRAENEAARSLLAGSPPESWLVRVLADGMDDRSVLRRLFEDQLAGRSFPEADKIVWIVEQTRAEGDVVELALTSSAYWLGPLRETRSFTSDALPDAPAG